jgi:hypothetical protein
MSTSRHDGYPKPINERVKLRLARNELVRARELKTDQRGTQVIRKAGKT